MSTIGTTLKEPRVFAHDAIALSALTYPINTIATLTVVALSGGSGYTGAQVYDTGTANGGSGARVTATTVVGGEVTVASIAAGNGGINYQVGDQLTLTGGTSDSNCIVQVASITASTSWSLGDPLVPMPDNFNTVPYWNEKTTYTYELGGGHPNPGPHTTPGPGAALYISSAMDITVVMESGKIAEFKGVNAGSFLPVSVLSVSVATPLENVLVLF